MIKANLSYSFASSFLLQLNGMKSNSMIKNIIKAENKVDPKYKTEICKKFQSTGYCPYGYKCRFAHGKQELLMKQKGKNYKKRPCKSFFEKGYCPYGSRCNFRHNEKVFSEINYSYYYFQLFLLMKYGNNPTSKNFLHSIGSNLINDRLPVFKTLTENLSNDRNDKNNFENLIEPCKDVLLEIKIGRKNSISTFSNTSNEEDKKGNFMYNEDNSNNY